jgi:hypothetical protein
MKYLLSIAIIPALLFGWIAVQGIYRRFARRHPELGPFRSESGGCGSCSGGSGCSGSSQCKTDR